MEKEKRNLYTFLFVVMIKRREVIAVSDNGEEYIFDVVIDAVKILNIAQTTDKRHGRQHSYLH